MNRRSTLKAYRYWNLSRTARNELGYLADSGPGYVDGRVCSLLVRLGLIRASGRGEWSITGDGLATYLEGMSERYGPPESRTIITPAEAWWMEDQTDEAAQGLA